MWKEGLNHTPEQRPEQEQTGLGMNTACPGDHEGTGLEGGLGGTAEVYGILIWGPWGDKVKTSVLERLILVGVVHALEG